MVPLFFFLVAPLAAASPENKAGDIVEDYRKEIQQINANIKDLEKERNMHAELANKYQLEGDRWKYERYQIDDAYKWWGKADDERKQVFAIQEQIDVLEARKARILQFYPQLQEENL